MPPTVVIDPGHGGSARVGGSSPNNATGPNGLLEKNLTLDLAQRVSTLLAPRATVVLTRTTDENKSLDARARMAQSANASAFVSIHLNGFTDPSVDGSEAWVATQSGSSSHMLAQSVLDKVAGVTGAPNRGVKAQDFGVLLPDRVGASTAASLVEVAFLTNPAEAQRLADETYRQSIAQAIADGIAAQLPAAAPVPVPAPAPPTAQPMGYRALTTSAQTTALATIASFRAETTSGAFTPTRADVADRAVALINDPTLVQQGGLPLCGPAAVHRLWIERAPDVFATYISRLYDFGNAPFGPNGAVSAGTDLKNKDYYGVALPAMRALAASPATASDYECPAADWVAMSALRDSTNTFLDYEGMPSETASGMTLPGDIVGWLRNLSLYSAIDDQSNDFIRKGVDHAMTLAPSGGVDVVMLINAHVLTSSGASGVLKSDEFILSAFPNHFIVLRSAVTAPTSTEVEFDCWTWGQNRHFRVPRDVMDANYYGAIIATV